VDRQSKKVFSISNSPTNSYFFAEVGKTSTRILCDTGAFCNCISLSFLRKLKVKAEVKPQHVQQKFQAANDATLNVVGVVDLDVRVDGLLVPVTFYVIENLSQNCIVGTPFLEETKAIINFKTKTLTLYEDVLTIPLITSSETDTTIKTVKKTRIPPFSEVILPAKMQCQDRIVTGITEALPPAINRNILVANVLQDSSKGVMMCRLLNPTRRWIYLPIGFPFAYLSEVDLSTVGVNAVNMSVVNDKDDDDDVVNNDNTDDVNATETDLPCHQERLKYLTSLGVRIGDDACNKAELEQLTALIYNYRDIFATDYKDVPAADISPHTIPLIDNKPLNQRRFRYNPTQERNLEKQCDELLNAGILRESNSPWNSPVFLISKPDKSSRFLVDFRGVNAKTEPLYCNLPSLEEVFDEIGEEQPTIYSVMDLKAGFYSVPLAEESKACTAFSTKSRHLEFERIPQGYRNSPCAFTAALNSIFAKELRTTLIIYVDDLITYSRNMTEHLKILEQIFARFRQYKLRLHPAKLRFAMSSVNFLGYHLGQKGYSVDTSRTSVMQNYPRPRNVREIKRYLGLTNFYRRLIRNYSKRAAPLRQLLGKDAKFMWGEAQETAFCDLRDALCRPPILGFPDRNKPLRSTLDACATGLGYVLSNINSDGTETVLHYGARATTRAERNYSATDLELAALLTGIRTFHSYLANTKFQILSDHVSLTYIQNLKFGPSRLVRASIFLSQYDFTIKHVAGRANPVADAISRITDIKADNLTVCQEQRHSDDDDFVCTIRGLDDNDDIVGAVNNAKMDDNDDNTAQNVVSQTNADVACAVNNASLCNNVVRITNDAMCARHDAVCTTNNVVTKDDDIADVEQPGPDQANNNMCDDVKTVYTDKHETNDENTHFLSVIQRHKKTDRTDKIKNWRSRQRADTATDASTAAQLLADSLSLSTNNDTAAVPDTNCCMGGPGGNSDAGDVLSGRSDVGGPPDEVDRRAPSDAAIDDDVSITLQTQAKDADFGNIINYFLYGNLPGDDKQARRVLLLSDYYAIMENKLFHLMASRRKNNKMQQPLMRQLCIPSHMRLQLLQNYHNQLMHAGAERMFLSMKPKVYWPDIYNDTRKFVASCEICHKVKADTHPIKAKIQTRDIPATLFHTIHIDHLRLSVPNATHKFQYVLIIIDEFSLQVELIPTKTTSAKETAISIFERWICKYGCPRTIISDRHKSFTGHLIQCLFKLCNVKHVLISPRNARSNGLVEQTNKRVIDAIRIHCSNYSEWHRLLPPIAGAYRAAVTPTRQYSPFFLMYGCHMTLPTDLQYASTLPAHSREDINIDRFRDQMRILRSEVQEFAHNNRERAIAAQNKSKTDHQYQVGDHVYLANEIIKPDEYRKSVPRFTGPFLVLAKSDHNTYKLSHIYTGKILKNFIHHDKLRPSNSARQMLEDKYKKNLSVNTVCMNDLRSGNDNALQSLNCISGVNEDATDKQAQKLIRAQAPSAVVQMSDSSLYGYESPMQADNSIFDCDDAEMHARPTPAAKEQANTYLIDKLRQKCPDSSEIRSAALERRNELQTDHDDDRQETDGIKNELSLKSCVGATETSMPNAGIYCARTKVIDKNSGVDIPISTRAIIGPNTNVHIDRTSANRVEWPSNDATYLFPFDNTIFNVNDDNVDGNNFDESVECDERLHEHTKRANDMKRVLKIKRHKGFLRCYVLLRDGRRVTCRPMQVPLKLMSEYRLRNYNKRNQ